MLAGVLPSEGGVHATPGVCRSGTVRLIARLDVKAPNLIKGVHLEGLRKLGGSQRIRQTPLRGRR